MPSKPVIFTQGDEDIVDLTCLNLDRFKALDVKSKAVAFDELCSILRQISEHRWLMLSSGEVGMCVVSLEDFGLLAKVRDIILASEFDK